MALSAARGFAARCSTNLFAFTNSRHGFNQTRRKRLIAVANKPYTSLSDTEQFKIRLIQTEKEFESIIINVMVKEGWVRVYKMLNANVVYISLIRPILVYCDTLWGCCGEGNSQALEALQKRAGRIVAKTSRSSPAMDILKWPALAERRREHVFQQELVKKCIEGRCPQYFDGYFTFNNKIHSRATRQRDLLHLPAVRTEVAKRSFYCYGCVVFNDICLCLKN